MNVRRIDVEMQREDAAARRHLWRAVTCVTLALVNCGGALFRLMPPALVIFVALAIMVVSVRNIVVAHHRQTRLRSRGGGSLKESD